jgi:hypothetical protein
LTSEDLNVTLNELETTWSLDDALRADAMLNYIAEIKKESMKIKG